MGDSVNQILDISGEHTWQPQSVDLLSCEDSNRACDSIFRLRQYWHRHHPTFEFYTLGVPSYLEATNGRFRYYKEQALSLNPTLKESFGWIYKRLLAALTGLTGQECFYDDQLSYPGFHIFKGPQAAASRHCDLQYANIDWTNYKGAECSEQLSFTLSLRLPRAGSGLYLWSIDGRKLESLSVEQRQAYVKDRQVPDYYSYRTGALVVHNGHHLHQIGRLSQMKEGDERLTLQGHAISTAKGWLLYW
jgi:hypothetical protein